MYVALTLALQYAYWTQRGYYPDTPHQANQDSCSGALKFAGEEKDAMFAVYDGHGRHGRACSQFCKDHLPKLVEKYVRRMRCQKYRDVAPPGTVSFNPKEWPMLDEAEYQQCCQKAFLECNESLHKSTTVS